MRMFEICEDSPNARIRISTSNTKHIYKLLPKNTKIKSSDILIYDGKVAIINYRGGKTNVVLQSPDFYNNLKELFDFMWDLLSELEETRKIK